MHKIFKTQYEKLLNKFFRESNLKITELNFNLSKIDNLVIINNIILNRI
jgi:hypothetical protein